MSSAVDQRLIEQKRARKLSDSQLSDLTVRNLMNSMPGRRWIWLLLAKCHMFENITAFDGTGDSPLKTYFTAGERNVGLGVLADVMRLCPREYVLAMEENAKLELASNGPGRTSSGSGNDFSTSNGDDGGDESDE